MASHSRHQALGTMGETLATAHLRRDGMRIVDRNWRCDTGELDIVAEHRNTLVFCEVKTRRSLRRGTAVSAVDAAKAERVRKLALRWRSAHRTRSRRCRIDVIGVVVHGDERATIDHRIGVL